MLKAIDTIVPKLNKDYKPLGVAVFLVVGGLLFGFLFLPKAGIEEKGILGGQTFIAKAQGAEVERAELTVQDSPTLVLTNAENGNVRPVHGNQFFYTSEGAVKDTAQISSK